jgi:hypothetical protein
VEPWDAISQYNTLVWIRHDEFFEHGKLLAYVDVNFGFQTYRWHFQVICNIYKNITIKFTWTQLEIPKSGVIEFVCLPPIVKGEVISFNPMVQSVATHNNSQILDTLLRVEGPLLPKIPCCQSSAFKMSTLSRFHTHGIEYSLEKS